MPSIAPPKSPSPEHSIAVRAATESDVSDIATLLAILNTSFYDFSEPGKIVEFVSGGLAFVSAQGLRLTGAMLIDPAEGNWQIYAIASVERGSGRKLVELAFDKCREQGIPKVWCWSLERYNAAGFWRNLGFSEEILLHKQFHGENCYLFGKVVEKAT